MESGALTTCELAFRCKVLRDQGYSGPQIARELSRSDSYVNNLIRIIDRASPAVLQRWTEEQAGDLHPVCATDWLIHVCVRPHEDQDAELARRISASTSRRRQPAGTGSPPIVEQVASSEVIGAGEPAPIDAPTEPEIPPADHQEEAA